MPKFEIGSLEEALEATKDDKSSWSWSSDDGMTIVMHEVPRCLECSGTNLNEEGTMCWDYVASEYVDEGPA